MNPKISVIIPTFNRLPVLARAIESVITQDYAPFEIIIIDDGSRDATKDFVTSLKNYSIRYYYQENEGVSKARNFAAKISNGEWLAFLDSDDEWLPTKLSSQVQLLKTNSKLPLIHTEEIWVRNGKRVNQKKKHQKLGGRIFKDCLPLCRISPSSSLIRKDVFLDLQGFREDFEVCEDYDLWLKITSKYQVGYIEEPQIIKYGGHEDQLSSKYHSMDIWRIQALLGILNSPELSPDERKATLEEIAKKYRVLQLGYGKRNKLHELDTIFKKRKIILEERHLNIESM